MPLTVAALTDDPVAELEAARAAELRAETQRKRRRPKSRAHRRAMASRGRGEPVFCTGVRNSHLRRWLINESNKGGAKKPKHKRGERRKDCHENINIRELPTAAGAGGG